MSSFLPDSYLRPPTNPVTGSALQVSADQTVTDDSDVALMQRVLGAAAKRPQQIPETFLAYLQDWLQIVRLEVPIGQVQGFTQFTAQSATAADLSASLTSGQSASATGPAIAAPGTGNFIVLAGGDFNSPNGTATYTVSGAAGVVTIAVTNQVTVSLFKAALWKNSDPSQGLSSTLQVTATGGSSTHAITGPTLIVLKYANL